MISILNGSSAKTEVRGIAQRVRLVIHQVGAGFGCGVHRVDGEAGQFGIHAIDHHRAERDSDVLLEAVRGLDQLVHRRLLGKRHEHYPTP